MLPAREQSSALREHPGTRRSRVPTRVAPVTGTFPCLACGHPAVADQKVLIRAVEQDLYRCPDCGLFFFPEPTWLDEVYAEPISELDIGLPLRCINHARIIETLIRAQHLQKRTHLDYGGGYGLLTRLMRDRGIDMRHLEPYTENLFAQRFEGDLDRPYGAITAIEVFEHLTDPRATIASMAPWAEMIIIGTELVPDDYRNRMADWWYVGPSGQHITFYTPAALTTLGREHGYEFSTNGSSIHLLHREPLSPTARYVLKDVRTSVILARVLRAVQRSGSLRDEDGRTVVADYLSKVDWGRTHLES
jgi:hypothetical protein